jgi:hypothetical protein
MALPASSSPDLDAVFAQARKLIQREQNIEIDHHKVWDEIRRCLEDAGLPSGSMDAFLMMRDGFMKEAGPADMHAVEGESYGGLTSGKQLFEMRWRSSRCKREMYLKFALYDGRFVLMRFHESVRPPAKVVGIQTKRSLR